MAGGRPRLAQARRASGMTQEDLAHRVGVDRSTVGRWEAGQSIPQPWARRKLADLLGVSLARLNDVLTCSSTAADTVNIDDEIDAAELVRRVSASDVGEATLSQLERAVDGLASSYATLDPAALLNRTRQHLRYVGKLFDVRKTLSEHRRLLVVGGWLSLLAGTLHVDLEQQGPAVARLGTARTLAREAGHDEIIAWCLETEAWRALTLGDYRSAAAISAGAQRVSPRGTSVLIQATAQEGRAWARLADTRSTRDAVDRVNRMASPLSTPDQPEHHYRYDPAKATSYTATTLSWLGDPAAVDFAREVIRDLASDQAHGGRPRRLAVARLDLALALIKQGQLDEAAHSAIDAMISGRVAPSNRWRALEVVRAAEAADSRQARQLREAYHNLLHDDRPTRTRSAPG